VTGDISEDESRVCRCTMGLFPCDKSSPRNEDVLGEVSCGKVVVLFLMFLFLLLLLLSDCWKKKLLFEV